MMIGVVGLGVLGKAHRDYFIEHDYVVLGYDTDGSGGSSLEDIALSCDVIFVCVPTLPLYNKFGPIGIEDVEVLDIVRELKSWQNMNSTIVVRSTVGMGFFHKLGWTDDEMRVVYLPDFSIVDPTEPMAAKDFRSPHRPYVLGLPVESNGHTWSESLRNLNKKLWSIMPRTGETTNLVTYGEAVAIRLATTAFYAVKSMFAVSIRQYLVSCRRAFNVPDLKYEKVAAVMARDPRIGSNDNDRLGRDVHLRLKDGAESEGFGQACLQRDFMEVLFNLQDNPTCPDNHVLLAAWEHDKILRSL